MQGLQKTLRKVDVKESLDQSAILAENYLQMYDMSCVQRSFCEVGTTSRVDFTDGSVRAAQQSMM